MKSVHYLYEKTYLSRIMDESMSPNSLSSMLSSFPEDQSAYVMKRLIEKGEYILMDSTAVFSRYENISFLELGHNSKDTHLPELNVMMLFSASRTKPTLVRMLAGVHR